MRILIINLTRMGDIIQTNPLINSLHKKYPTAEIDYFCAKSFKKILDSFENINQVFSIDVDKILENKNDILTAYSEISFIIQKLKVHKYDILINPIVSRQSALFGVILSAIKKNGMFFNKEKEHTLTSKWSSFHLANEHNMGDRTLNLVDIFAGIGEVKVDYKDFNLNFIEKEIVLDKYENLKIIGFHIGASNPNKTWKPEKFKFVMNELLKDKNNVVVLFGGYKERSFKKYFDFNSERFVNLIDKTKLNELILHISKLDLFITNDTGPMHIAAALKRKIINISLGPVSLWETGPFCENSLILQANIECHPCAFSTKCEHLSCNKYIETKHLLRAVDIIFARKNNFIDEKVHLWRSQLDLYGFHHYVPYTKREIEEKELFFEIKRFIWISTLNEKISKDNFERYLNYLKEFYFINGINFFQKIEILNDISFRLKEIIQLFNINKKDIDKLKQNWNVIKCKKHELSTMIKENLNSIFDFILFLNFQESSLKENDLEILWNSTRELYIMFLKQINEFISALRRLNEITD